jgi:hypothetical protein
VDQPGTPGRLLQGVVHGGVEPPSRVVQRLGGDAGGLEPDTVEAGRDLPDRRGAAPADVLADRPDGVEHRVDVRGGARQDVPQVTGARAGRPAQVDSSDHPDSLGTPSWLLGRARSGSRAVRFTA